MGGIQPPVKEHFSNTTLLQQYYRKYFEFEKGLVRHQHHQPAGSLNRFEVAVAPEVVFLPI